MSAKSAKRIQNDMKLYHKSDINNHGIYVHFNETNIYNAKALIIGPDETPYKNGFYLFDINYTDKYPQEPPKVLLCTLNSRTRFNPNLYTRGKVCLSILGTWSGPGWTPCLSTCEILLSIQSLLNKNPIQNEPGYEKLTIENSPEARKYIQLIEYHNHLIAVAQIVEELPSGFECFKDLIGAKFCEFYDENIKFLQEKCASDLNQEIVSLRMYSLSDKLRYAKLIKKYKDIYQQLLPKYGNTLTDSAPSTSTVSGTDDATATVSGKDDATVTDKTLTKKIPSVLAHNYTVGTTIISDNDNREYIIKEIKGKKNSVYKKWILKK